MPVSEKSYSSVSKSDSIEDRIKAAVDSTGTAEATNLLAAFRGTNLPIPIFVVSVFCSGSVFLRQYLPYLDIVQRSGVPHLNFDQFQAVHGCILRRASSRELKATSEKYNMNPKLSHSDGTVTIKRRKIRAKGKEVRHDPQFTFRKTIQGREIFFPVGTNGHTGLSIARKIKKAIQSGMPLKELLLEYHPSSKFIKEIGQQGNEKGENTFSDSAAFMSVSLAKWEDYLEEKEQSGVSSNTLVQAKNLLRRFKNHFGAEKSLSDFETKQIRSYLNSVPKGSYNHHLRAVKGLFNWAVESELIKENPAFIIKLRKRPHKEPAILSCQDAENLVKAALKLHNKELLAYAAITLFGGLRPDSEMRQIGWSDINLEDSEIIVRKGKKCTPRTVDMPENLGEWLHLCDHTTPIYPKNFREKWSKVRVAAGFRSGAARTKNQKKRDSKLKPWVPDYTRHTAISHRLRQTGDITKTATWAGNSPVMIRSHYLGRVTAGETANYWLIVPSEKKD